jgi:Short C-terminal domain
MSRSYSWRRALVADTELTPTQAERSEARRGEVRQALDIDGRLGRDPGGDPRRQVRAGPRDRLGYGEAYSKLSASKKVSVLVEPPGGQPYQATLKIERNGPDMPVVPGTRFDVLVDPDDPQHLALPADPTYTLRGGRTWAPEHGLAGAFAEASRRGDAAEVMRLTSQIKASAPPAPNAGGGEPDTIEQRERLSKLHESGALTDDEFNAQKAKVLGAGNA